MADLIPRTEAYIAKMRNYLAFAADGTYPHVAPCKGRAFNKYILTIISDHCAVFIIYCSAVYSAFGDCQIEDAWIPFYCMSTGLHDFSRFMAFNRE